MRQLARGLGALLILVIGAVAAQELVTTRDGSSQSALRFLPYVFTAVVVGVFATARLRSGKAAKAYLQAQALLAQGRYSAALEQLSLWQRVQPRSAVALSWVGHVHLLLWRPEEAVPLLTRALELARSSEDLRAATLPNLLLGSALLGKEGDVAQWLGRCKGAALEAFPAGLLGQAVMACREARWSDARPLLLRSELQQLGGVWRALHDVLLAWCAEALSGERRPVNKPALFGEASVDRARGVWPELVAFVERAPSV